MFMGMYVCVIPSGMGTQWAGMGRSLMQLQDFRASIQRSDLALKDTGLCVSRLLMEADENTFEDTVHAFVGLAAIQVRVPRWRTYTLLKRAYHFALCHSGDYEI